MPPAKATVSKKTMAARTAAKAASQFSSRSVHAPRSSAAKAQATNIGHRDMLLITILSTAFLAVIFAALAKNADLAMYAMTAITIIASVALVLVVLLVRE